MCHPFVASLWENPNDPRWRVPRLEVEAAIDNAFAQLDFRELACDPWGWRTEIEAWAKKHGRRRVVEFNTGAAPRMAPATDRFYQAVMTKTLSHDGSDRFAEHVGNCIAKPTPMGDLVSKDKRGSTRRIDASVAAIVAYERRSHGLTRRSGRDQGSTRRAVSL